MAGRRIRGLPTCTYFSFPVNMHRRMLGSCSSMCDVEQSWCTRRGRRKKGCDPPAFLHCLLERAQPTGRNFQERAVTASAAPLGLGLVGAGTTADCSGAPALEEEMSIP